MSFLFGLIGGLGSVSSSSPSKSEFVSLTHYDGTKESIRRSNIDSCDVQENENRKRMYGHYEAPWLLVLRMNDGSKKSFGYSSQSEANKALEKI